MRTYGTQENTFGTAMIDVLNKNRMKLQKIQEFKQTELILFLYYYFRK